MDNLVIFTERAFNAIVTETLEKHPVETGGIFMGYILENGVRIVVEMVPPGLKTLNTVVDFEYDVEFVNYLGKVLMRQYDKELMVLGLWHRHPGSMDYFSSTDDVTNKKFASQSAYGAISALVNCDPKMRLTMYHVSVEGTYTRIPWLVDKDGDLIPAKFTAVKYPDAEALPEVQDARYSKMQDGLKLKEAGAPGDQVPDRKLKEESLKLKEEGVELRLEVRNHPKVTLPQDMLDKHYVGALRGYHVANTNIFNILPTDTPLDARKVERLGEIYEDSSILDAYPGSRSRIAWKNRETAKLRRFVAGLFTGDESNRPSPFLAETEKLIGFWDDDTLKLVSTADIEECELTPYTLKQDVFSRNTGILESDIMLRKGAVIMGCGSVGSLMALELAKAGVGRFMLVDSDIFGYHNICRHQCGIYDVGRYKTEALRDRILAINPYAQVVVETKKIQEVSEESINAFCDEDGIMIGCADNYAGDLYANDLAVRHKMAFLTLACWNRAFAGDIFYCLPEGMPTYDDFIKVTGLDIEHVEQNRQFYTTEEDLANATFEPGISVDIDYVTIVGAKLAIDLLNRDNEGYTQRLTPYFKQYTILCNTNSEKVGGDKAKIFTYPLQYSRNIVLPYADESKNAPA